MTINPLAQRFDGTADAYERGRPEYPAEATSHIARVLGIGPGRTVVDLGAGTGKFTRALVATGASVIAVEPVAGMRERLAKELPTVVAVEGTGESIPLPGASVDAVTSAQAFHWFRGREALAEIRRVLKPGGGLALAWNVSGKQQDWVRQLEALLEPHRGNTPDYRTGKWREAFNGPTGFTPLQAASIPFTTSASPSHIADRVASASFVAGLSDKDRTELLERVRRLLSEHSETRGRDRIDSGQVTDVYWCYAA